MHSFIEAIDKRNCLNSGYFHAEFWGRSDWKQEGQDKLEPYDLRTAILWFYLSHLCMAETKTLWGDGEITKPDRNVLPIRSEVEAKNKIGV